MPYPERLSWVSAPLPKGSSDGATWRALAECCATPNQNQNQYQSQKPNLGREHVAWREEREMPPRVEPVEWKAPRVRRPESSHRIRRSKISHGPFVVDHKTGVHSARPTMTITCSPQKVARDRTCPPGVADFLRIVTAPGRSHGHRCLKLDSHGHPIGETTHACAVGVPRPMTATPRLCRRGSSATSRQTEQLLGASDVLIRGSRCTSVAQEVDRTGKPSQGRLGEEQEGRRGSLTSL